MRKFSLEEIIDFRSNPDGEVSYCKRWTPTEVETLKAEYLAGETITDIALCHNRTESAVLNRLKRESVVYSRPRKPDWC